MVGLGLTVGVPHLSATFPTHDMPAIEEYLVSTALRTNDFSVIDSHPFPH